MTISKYIGILLGVLLVFAGCRKEDEGSDVPEIEFVSMSASEVEQFSNSIEIVFQYTDRNGDIGETDPDAICLEVKDARLVNADYYHIPPVTPDLQELKVEGTIGVFMNPLFLLGSTEEETTTLSLRLRDRAGNWSNTIQTPVITIRDTL